MGINENFSGYKASSPEVHTVPTVTYFKQSTVAIILSFKPNKLILVRCGI